MRSSQGPVDLCHHLVTGRAGQGQINDSRPCGCPKSCCCSFSFPTAIFRGWHRVSSWACESLGSKVGPLTQTQELSPWVSPPPECDLPFAGWAAAPLAQAQLPLPHCTVAKDMAGSANVPGQPGLPVPACLVSCLGRWVARGWGLGGEGSGCPEGAGPGFLSEGPFRLELSIPRTTPRGSWGWPAGQKGT